MLNRNICKAYNEGVKTRQSKAQVLATASKQANSEKYEAQPVVHTVDAATFLAGRELSEEIFGPASLVVLCKDAGELQSVLQSLEGQLTATVHAAETDEQAVTPVVEIITQKAGRVIYGGYPTGVEVCHSMQHGGPFPATTDARFTAVGADGISRFARPICFQNWINDLLPPELQDGNPRRQGALFGSFAYCPRYHAAGCRMCGVRFHHNRTTCCQGTGCIAACR